MTSSQVATVFGPLVGPATVEDAVIRTLRTWLVTYLAEVERQTGLPDRTLRVPPSKESFYGGVDSESWVEDELPSLIVIVAPSGEPERKNGDYAQMYEVQVAAVVKGEHEDHARRVVQHYGAAVQGAIVQRGSLGIDARTRLTGSPQIAFPRPDVRRLARVTVSFQVYVDVTVSDRYGPAVPPRDPYAKPAGAVAVEATDVTVSPLP